eukprot:TRINITY_DN36256_c0_g1_i2.p1 TRINITY_DN36256_c0_g1~~TRINITY_DN36256_c0_g1_i2.p1  ORF type:complete len:220 (+),score=34.99 TRINITY_DN36256_c0_g1_i2:51-662(+)
MNINVDCSTTSPDFDTFTPGALTATHYVVMYEADLKTAQAVGENFKFCVDMPDISSCELKLLPPKYTMNKQMAVLTIHFKQGYQNRFMFNPSTGATDKSPELKDSVYLRGEHESLRQLHEMLDLGIQTNKKQLEAALLLATDDKSTIYVDGKSDLIHVEVLKQLVRSCPPRWHLFRWELLYSIKIGRAVQQECRDRSRMPSSA